MNIEIANRLVELRKKNGLSQEELADKLGLSRQAVSKWERAESSPDTDNLICLAKLYNVSLDDLLDTNQSIEEISAEVKEKNLEEKVEAHVKRDRYAHLSEKERKRARAFDVVEHIVTSTGFTVAVIVYFAISFKDPEQWKKLWVIFMAPVVLSSIFNSIKNRRFCQFAYPVFITMLYLTLGVYLGIWHPTWILFISIPIFYMIFEPIDKLISHKRNEPLDPEDPADEDDDDDED